MHRLPAVAPVTPAPPQVTLPTTDSEEELAWLQRTKGSLAKTADTATGSGADGPVCDQAQAKEGVTSNKPGLLGPAVKIAPRESSLRHAQIPEPPVVQINGKDFADPDDSSSKIDVTFHNSGLGHRRHFTDVFGVDSRQVSIDLSQGLEAESNNTPKIDLRQTSHVDVYNKPDYFNVHDSCQHRPVARDWPTTRKRFTAVVACVNATCIALIIGIYAGELPAIQYAIADQHGYAVLGNVFFFIGIAVSALLFWPLPLLHGRKPYILASQSTALLLQLPQGLAVSSFRNPDVAVYRLSLLTSRTLSGLAIGLLDMNIRATVLDLFGASLQSRTGTYSESDPFDVRRHGGGMGLWFGILSWCTVGPISIGFMIGASVLHEGASVAWGFWISLVVLCFTLLLNIIAPEVRRSAFRRTVAEMIGAAGEFSRVTRGEVKMHLDAVGPAWWGEELVAGLQLCWQMILQPGFLVVTIYCAWIYAQFLLVLMVSHLLPPRHD